MALRAGRAWALLRGQPTCPYLRAAAGAQETTGPTERTKTSEQLLGRARAPDRRGGRAGPGPRRPEVRGLPPRGPAHAVRPEPAGEAREGDHRGDLHPGHRLRPGPGVPRQ